MLADLVLTNGCIHTIEARQPLVTAVAVANGRILAVGRDVDMKALLAPGGEWIDLQGRAVTPGLVDAHVHFQWYSLSLRHIDLFEVPTLAEAVQRVGAGAARAASGDWLRGRGWTQESWVDRRFPTAADLDQVTGDRPAIFNHKSGHAAWVNSHALQIAGITPYTPDPPSGHIQRDEAGRPTGILFEDAMELVSRCVPPPTAAEVADAMRQAQANCWRAGLVGLHDFDGSTCFQALQMLHQNGELGLRIVKNIPARYVEQALAVGLRSGFGDDWLRLGGVKIFADGALGPRTALMVEPYVGEPDNRGIAVTDKEEMLQIASQASAGGLSVTVHAIGDKANHDVLDVYEIIRREEAGRLAGVEAAAAGVETAGVDLPSHFPLRHRIEHVQLLHPADEQRLAQLGVIASMQPTHATSDMEMADRYWGPPERAQYSYAWRTVLNTGATLVFGSDCPIEPIEPLLGIYAAVTRRRPDGSHAPDGWFPAQKLTMAETIHAFTWAAAYTSGQEGKTGSIAPGKLADLTIYDRDLFAVPQAELLDVKIAGTVIAGNFKHRTF